VKLFSWVLIAAHHSAGDAIARDSTINSCDNYIVAHRYVGPAICLQY